MTLLAWLAGVVVVAWLGTRVAGWLTTPRAIVLPPEEGDNVIRPRFRSGRRR